MLKQRLLTAAILLAVLLGALAAPSAWPILLLLTALAVAALWEWLRMTMPATARLAVHLAPFLLGVLLLWLSQQMLADSLGGLAAWFTNALARGLVPLMAVCWPILTLVMVLQARVDAPPYSYGLSLYGVAASLALWFSLAVLYITYGGWFLLSFMGLIWAADSVAYFVGRALGKHKLAPKVSPGKTWEGVIGGILGGLVWMLLSALWEGSFSFWLVMYWGWGVMLLLGIAVIALSILGDLFESLLKRRAGVKDSSALLPGHGGVYDRIDALFPVAPLALLLMGV